MSNLCEESQSKRSQLSQKTGTSTVPRRVSHPGSGGHIVVSSQREQQPPGDDHRVYKPTTSTSQSELRKLSGISQVYKLVHRKAHIVGQAAGLIQTFNLIYNSLELEIQKISEINNIVPFESWPNSVYNNSVLQLFIISLYLDIATSGINQ